RRAWEERARAPFLAMLDVEGLKWVNDNIGWSAGDALLKAGARAIVEEGVRGCRLGGGEVVFGGARRGARGPAGARVPARLAGAEVDAVLAGGTRRRLRSARVHAGIGRSLEEADAALMRAKKAGVASGERAERGRRPRGLAEVLGWRPRSEKGRDSGLRFYLRALQAADPDFDAPALEDESRMSREWRVRSLR